MSVMALSYIILSAVSEWLEIGEQSCCTFGVCCSGYAWRLVEFMRSRKLPSVLH